MRRNVWFNLLMAPKLKFDTFDLKLSVSSGSLWVWSDKENLDRCVSAFYLTIFFFFVESSGRMMI